MDISVVFWEFLVIAFIFTATIIASEFVRRWLEKIEKDDIQSETETSNLVFAETDCQSCDPHFFVVEETVKSVPMDSSSLFILYHATSDLSLGLVFHFIKSRSSLSLFPIWRDKAVPPTKR